MQLLINTPASVSITVDNFKRYFSKQHALSKTFVDLQNPKQCINILGSFQVAVSVLHRACSIVFYIIDKGTSLLGLDVIQHLYGAYGVVWHRTVLHNTIQHYLCTEVEASLCLGAAHHPFR